MNESFLVYSLSFCVVLSIVLVSLCFSDDKIAPLDDDPDPLTNSQPAINARKNIKFKNTTASVTDSNKLLILDDGVVQLYKDEDSRTETCLIGNPMKTVCL